MQGERRSSSSRARRSGSRSAASVELRLDVVADLDGGVDARHGEGGRSEFVECVGEASGRVGGGQMDVAAALGQPDRDRRGDGGLADPAFAHDHHDARPGTVELVDQVVDAVDVGYVGLLDRRGGWRLAGDQGTEGSYPGEVAGDERHVPIWPGW